MQLEDIERAIDELSPEQVEELYLWLDRHHSQPIDTQLKADLDAGKMDDRIARAVADDAAGRTDPL